MKTLYAGPWCGEFGWELAWWNPVVRHLAKQYDRIIIGAPKTSEYLYEFATEFIGLDTIPISFWDGNYKGGWDPEIRCSLFSDNLFEPIDLFKTKDPQNFLINQCEFAKHYRILANPKMTILPIDIMCAFRPPKSYKGRGYTIACYGGLDNYWFDGTIDLRGQPLKNQCDFLGVAKCALGPSSGTLHLASLCNCPHIVWYASVYPDLKTRYEKLWNPFDTSVIYLGNLLPTPDLIAKAVQRLIE